MGVPKKKLEAGGDRVYNSFDAGKAETFWGLFEQGLLKTEKILF